MFESGSGSGSELGFSSERVSPPASAVRARAPPTSLKPASCVGVDRIPRKRRGNDRGNVDSVGNADRRRSPETAPTNENGMGRARTESSRSTTTGSLVSSPTGRNEPSAGTLRRHRETYGYNVDPAPTNEHGRNKVKTESSRTTTTGSLVSSPTGRNGPSADDCGRHRETHRYSVDPAPTDGHGRNRVRTESNRITTGSFVSCPTGRNEPSADDSSRHRGAYHNSGTPAPTNEYGRNRGRTESSRTTTGSFVSSPTGRRENNTDDSGRHRGVHRYGMDPASTDEHRRSRAIVESSQTTTTGSFVSSPIGRKESNTDDSGRHRGEHQNSVDLAPPKESEDNRARNEGSRATTSSIVSSPAGRKETSADDSCRHRGVNSCSGKGSTALAAAVSGPQSSNGLQQGCTFDGALQHTESRRKESRNEVASQRQYAPTQERLSLRSYDAFDADGVDLKRQPLWEVDNRRRGARGAGGEAEGGGTMIEIAGEKRSSTAVEVVHEAVSHPTEGRTVTATPESVAAAAKAAVKAFGSNETFLESSSSLSLIHI